MADLVNYNVADYQNPEEATQLGTNQGKAAQNVLENTNKNYRSGADYIKGLWSSPDKSNRFKAISNVLGNVIGAAGNALKGEGSKGTQWNDFVNRYNDTMQRAGEQAAQDTSTNVNTANVNALNRDQAEQQLAQARDVGQNTDLATETNIVRGQNLLGGASAKDRALTDIAAAVTNMAQGANANADTSANTGGNKNLSFDEVKEYMPGLNVKDVQDLNNIDFNKGFGLQPEDVKKKFYTNEEWKKLNSNKVTDAEKIAIGRAAQARYNGFKNRG